MNKRKAEEVLEEPKKEKVKSAGGRSFKRGLVNVLDGTFLTREKVLSNMPFLLFLAGLMLFNIGYGHCAERTVRDLDRVGRGVEGTRNG